MNPVFQTLKEHLKRSVLANGYLLNGPIEAQKLSDFLRQYGEVRLFLGETGINEARKIKELSFIKPESGRKTFFIIEVSRAGHFLPQAILKAVEDSQDNRHFFILSDRPDLMPDTLRSRLVEIKIAGSSSNDLSNFMKSDYQSRIEFTRDLAEDKEKFAGFLDDLERWMLDKNRHDFIPKIRQARESAMIFNISRKMCLEYLTHLLIY